MRFTTTNRESLEHGMKFLVFGTAGSGKTWLCGTAPSPLIISAESGLLTLRHQDIPAILVKNIDEVDEAYDWCAANAVSHGLRTICLDSISEITEQCLHAETAKTKDPRQAYGKMAGRVIDLVKKFRDLPGLHVIITAKQTVATDPISGASKASPTAPGQQVGPALPYLFDFVFHAFTDKDPTTGGIYHALRTHASPNAEAKDRSGVLADIEWPDVSKLIEKIKTTPAP